MALSNPFIVFGIVTDFEDNPLIGYTVTATDNTHAGSTTDETGSNGEYELDLQNISVCEDGDSITISCGADSSNFTLDISDPFKRIDLQLEGEEEDAVIGYMSIIGTGTMSIEGNTLLSLIGN